MICRDSAWSGCLRKPGQTFSLSRTWHLPLLMVRGTYTLLLQFHRPGFNNTTIQNEGSCSRVHFAKTHFGFLFEAGQIIPFIGFH